MSFLIYVLELPSLSTAISTSASKISFSNQTDKISKQNQNFPSDYDFTKPYLMLQMTVKPSKAKLMSSYKI